VKKPHHVSHEPPSMECFREWLCSALPRGLFTFMLVASVMVSMCFYALALVSAPVSVSFEAVAQTARLAEPLEVSFTCRSELGCVLSSRRPDGDNQPWQIVDTRSTVQVKLPFAVMERTETMLAAGRSSVGEGLIASVSGTYGESTDLFFGAQGANRSHHSSTKLLPTLKRTISGAVATAFSLDDSTCLSQDLQLCRRSPGAGSSSCNVVCSSSMYFRLTEQQVPSHSLLLGQLGAIIAVVLLVIVRVYSALHHNVQRSLQGCSGDDKDFSPDFLTIDVPCVQATWSSTWESGMQNVMAMDDGPQKVHMRRPVDLDEADFTIPSEEGRSQVVRGAGATATHAASRGTQGVADGQRNSLIDRSDVANVRQRIEDLLVSVNQSDSVQPEVMHVRDRVTAMLHSTQAVEARLSGGRSRPPVATQEIRSAIPNQLLPRPETYLVAPSAVSNTVLPPGVEAMMQYRLEALKSESGRSPGSNFDTSFWQRLEALESEAAMIERLERLEREQEEIRHVTGDHRPIGQNLPLKDRVDLMEQELHNRIDHNETELREQRLALKVFDAGFRHRLDAMDHGLKQHRDMLNRVTMIEAQVMKLHSFEAEFVKKLNTVHDQLERWASNST